MGQSPRRLLFDLPLVPLWMNGAQMAEQHPARAREHAAGDREPFGSRLQAKRGRHLFVDDFNAQVGERHGTTIIAGDSGAGRFSHCLRTALPLAVEAANTVYRLRLATIDARTQWVGTCWTQPSARVPMLFPNRCVGPDQRQGVDSQGDSVGCRSCQPEASWYALASARTSASA